jgi:hypothetical protein
MMVKSRMMRWAGHVEFMSEVTNICKIFVGKPEEERTFEDLGIDGRMILSES